MGGETQFAASASRLQSLEKGHPLLSSSARPIHLAEALQMSVSSLSPNAFSPSPAAIVERCFSPPAANGPLWPSAGAPAADWPDDALDFAPAAGPPAALHLAGRPAASDRRTDRV